MCESLMAPAMLTSCQGSIDHVLKGDVGAGLLFVQTMPGGGNGG